MAVQDYAQLKLFLNQNYAVQITSLRRRTASGQQPVDLLNEGLGGFTPGSGNVTLEIGYATPLGGTEFPYQETCAAGDYVDVQLVQGPKSFIGRGKFMDDDVNQSTNSNTAGVINWMGPLSALK